MRLEWCRRAQAYFCSACTKHGKSCPACGGALAQPYLGLAFILVLILLVTTSLTMIPDQLGRTLDINMPYSDIGQVSGGQTVKLNGTIDSPEKVAFVLEYKDDAWRLVRATDFVIVDSDGDRIQLDLRNCHDFYPESHNLSRTHYSEYWVGDKVTVFGTVSQDGAGARTLEVRRLYPGSTDPYLMMQDWYRSLWMVPAFTTIPFAFVLLAYWNRRRVHLKYIAAHPMDEADLAPRGMDDPYMDWKANPCLPQARTRARSLIWTSVVLAAILAAVSMVAPWSWEDYPWPMILSSMALLFTIVFGYFYYNERFVTPEYLATSERGLYIRYRPSARSKARTILIPWSSMTKTEHMPEFSRVHLSLHTADRIETITVPKEMGLDIERRADRGKIGPPGPGA